MKKLRIFNIIILFILLLQTSVSAEGYYVRSCIIDDVATTIYYLSGVPEDVENYTYITIEELDETGNNETEISTFNLLSDEQPLTLSSQIKLNGVNVGEEGMRIVDSGILNCNISVSNNSQSDDMVTVILATYTESKKLHQIKTVNIAVPSEGNSVAELSYEFDAGNEKAAKLMFWDSMSGMLPIRTSIDFSQISGVNAYYYDSDNRLIQVDKKNGKSIYYTYDKMGNLLNKTVGGAE